MSNPFSVSSFPPCQHRHQSFKGLGVDGGRALVWERYRHSERSQVVNLFVAHGGI